MDVGQMLVYQYSIFMNELALNANIIYSWHVSKDSQTALNGPKVKNRKFSKDYMHPYLSRFISNHMLKLNRLNLVMIELHKNSILYDHFGFTLFH